MVDKTKQQIPRPVRNQVAQPGEEVLVLRHQKLKKGEHQTFYEISRAGVWPWFEKIGARMVGQWRAFIHRLLPVIAKSVPILTRF